jgi:hypothetical protein
MLCLGLAALVGCGRPAPSVEAPTAAVASSGPAAASRPETQSAGPAAQSTPPGPLAPSGPTGSTGPTSSTGPSGATGPAPLPQLPVESAAARLGTIVLPLAGPGAEPVDAAATFEVRVGLGIRGARLILLDAQDVLVPSSAESEIGGGRSRYTLVPVEPLRTGSRYVLRLEGVESRVVMSDDGRPHEPLAVPFLVSGSPPPKAVPPKKGQKKRPP